MKTISQFPTGSRSADTSKDASPSQPSVIPRDVSKTREKWCNSTQRNTDCQGRKNVFGDLMKRASDSPPPSEGDKSPLPKSATNLNENREYRNADSRNNPEMLSQGLKRSWNECSKGNQDSQLHRSDTKLRSPLTPFSDVDIHEDVNGSEEELETDPFSVIIKCGWLAQGHWFLTPQMQDHQKMKYKCKRCQVPMHAECHAQARHMCNVCLKKKVLIESMKTKNIALQPATFIYIRVVQRSSILSKATP